MWRIAFYELEKDIPSRLIYQPFLISEESVMESLLKMGLTMHHPFSKRNKDAPPPIAPVN
jgi:hypothetical protein